MARRLLTAALLVAPGLAVAGCGHVQDDEVRAAASAYAAGLTAGDGAAACASLAPATRSQLEESTGVACPRAVLEEAVTDPGTVRQVEVFGTSAQVRLERDTLFLARFHDGWRVLAAACDPRGLAPYDCGLEGG